MRNALVILSVIFLMTLASLLQAEEAEKLSVLLLSKKEATAKGILEKVKAILPEFRDSIEVRCLDIEDEANYDLLMDYFPVVLDYPFAIAVDGCIAAMIDENMIEFLGYPHGTENAGDYEGNWKFEDLRAVIKDPGLLWADIWLPMEE
jgi:hypothetical protein